MKNVYSLLILTVAIVSSCEMPNEFPRDNPYDPVSSEFAPNLLRDTKALVNVLGLNQIELRWTSFFGVEKYQIFRRKTTDSVFVFVEDVFGYSDTVFVDTPEVVDKYQYKIHAVGKNGAFASILSRDVHSNLIPFSYIGMYHINGVSPSTSYGVKFNNNKVFIYFLRPFTTVPFFTILDLDTKEWKEVTLSNFINGDYLRTESLYPLDNNRLLIYRSLSAGNLFGSVCDLFALVCSPAGQSRFPPDKQPVNMAYTRLNDNLVLITGGLFNGSAVYEHFTHTFDQSTVSYELIGGQEEAPSPSALVTLPSGDVMACGTPSSSHPVNGWTPLCKVFDVETKTWKKTADMPIPSAISRLILLNDARVFLQGDAIKYAQIYDARSDSWEVTNPMKFSPIKKFINSFNKGIDYYRFRDPLLKMSNGNVLVLTYDTDELSGHEGRYYFEEYDPAIGDWVRLFDFPPNLINYIYAITPLGDDTFLVTHNGNNLYQEVKTSLFVYERRNQARIQSTL